MPTDFFRPVHNPARLLYDTIVKNPDPDAVWCAACDYAADNHLISPTFAGVVRAERMAQGHVDYAAKWAYGVAHQMSKAT